MFDHDTIRKILADDDSRSWSRLSDLGSDEVLEIYVTDRADSEQLAGEFREMGLDVAVHNGVALSAEAPDFWVVVGRHASPGAQLHN